MPTAGLAAQAAPGQQPAQQDFLTTIIWTIAALSIAEMIRNSIQGLFARLYGFNETGVAQKAVGAIAGIGALFGLANVMRATAGGHGGRQRRWTWFRWRRRWHQIVRRERSYRGRRRQAG